MAMRRVGGRFLAAQPSSGKYRCLAAAGVGVLLVALTGLAVVLRLDGAEQRTEGVREGQTVGRPLCCDASDPIATEFRYSWEGIAQAAAALRAADEADEERDAIFGRVRDAALYINRAPCAEELLREALRDESPFRVQYALGHLGWFASDFALAGPILDCAERHAQDAGIVYMALDILRGQGFTGLRWVPLGEAATDDTAAARRETVQRYRAFLAEGARQGTLPKSYEEFWGGRLWGTLQELPRVPAKEQWVYADGVGECSAMLRDSKDPRRAARVLIECLRRLDERHYGKVWYGLRPAPWLLRELQIHIGPVECPDGGDPREEKRAVRDILEWWKINEPRPPAEWMLQRLASRGYACAEPQKVRTTADAFLQAVTKGNCVERYTATRAMSLILPGGQTLPVPPWEALKDDEKEHDAERKGEISAWSAGRELWIALVRYRAARWAAWECFLYEWDSKQCRYVRKAQRP